MTENMINYYQFLEAKKTQIIYDRFKHFLMMRVDPKNYDGSSIPPEFSDDDLGKIGCYKRTWVIIVLNKYELFFSDILYNQEKLAFTKENVNMILKEVREYLKEKFKIKIDA